MFDPKRIRSLLRRSTSLTPQQVIEIIGGKISRTITGRGTVGVVSSAPHTIGGVPRGPGSAEQENGNPIAFVGRVPVRIVGPVQDNDRLVPSGSDDGTARAARPEDDLASIAVVGRACINESDGAAPSPVGFVQALVWSLTDTRASSPSAISSASLGKEDDDVQGWHVVSRDGAGGMTEEKVQANDTSITESVHGDCVGNGSGSMADVGANDASQQLLMNEVNKMREEMNRMKEESKKQEELIRFHQRVNTNNITLGTNYVRCKDDMHA
jgi:hypothetical protein